jgi:hypothetical protein
MFTIGMIKSMKIKCNPERNGWTGKKANEEINKKKEKK